MAKKSLLNSIPWKDRYYLWVDLLLVSPFLLIPFLLKLPYRVNLFLSWEGAYRMSIGQEPFVDFGLPMGYGYWLLPTLLFKIFGSKLSSLLITQFILNLATFFSVRGILKKLKINSIVVTVALFTLSLTYLIFNFWPWYNTSVVIYELIAIYFGLSLLESDKKFDYNGGLMILFSSLSFFTKQDVGALSILFSFSLLLVHAYRMKSATPIIWGGGIVAVFASIVILRYHSHGLFYWFNLGQYPHSSRISLVTILSSFFTDQSLAKYYILLVIVYFLFLFFQKQKTEPTQYLLMYLVLFLSCQSLVIAGTSPLGNNFNYFHPFGLVFLLSFVSPKLFENFPVRMAVLLLGVSFLFYSDGYWKYVNRLLGVPEDTETVVSDRKPTDVEKWEASTYYSTKGVLLPHSTIQGIERIRPLFNKEGLSVLNMSELTFLAQEFNYTPLTNHPLWFHYGIGIFDKEIDEIAIKIEQGDYDIVLFEDIPSLTEFYPSKLRALLKKDYKLRDEFLAPRKLEDSRIEVYTRD